MGRFISVVFNGKQPKAKEMNVRSINELTPKTQRLVSGSFEFPTVESILEYALFQIQNPKTIVVVLKSKFNMDIIHDSESTPNVQCNMCDVLTKNKLLELRNMFRNVPVRKRTISKQTAKIKETLCRFGVIHQLRISLFDEQEQKHVLDLAPAPLKQYLLQMNILGEQFEFNEPVRMFGVKARVKWLYINNKIERNQKLEQIVYKFLKSGYVCFCFCKTKTLFSLKLKKNNLTPIKKKIDGMLLPSPEQYGFLFDSNFLFKKEFFLECKVLRQVSKKFIVCSLQNLLFIVDQHAADERIILENLKSKMETSPCDAKRINFELNSFGFETINKHIVRIPKILLGHDEKIIPICNELLSGKSQTLDSLYKSKACRSALMFGDLLQNKECLKLIQALYLCNNPFQCAHGRPTLSLLVKVQNKEKTVNMAKFIKELKK